MRLNLGAGGRRTLIASIMLVGFAARALIPTGFMPASDRPFSIEICWEGFPADMLAHGERQQDSTSRRDALRGAHHRHSGSPSDSEHCVFGSACSTGPIPHLPLPSDTSSGQQLRAIAFVSIADAVRLVHLPQPRAPPVI
jgi:hypothetical protein